MMRMQRVRKEGRERQFFILQSRDLTPFFHKPSRSAKASYSPSFALYVSKHEADGEAFELDNSQG
jgi:hypothetical protein